jgi:hypothetical protein
MGRTLKLVGPHLLGRFALPSRSRFPRSGFLRRLLAVDRQWQPLAFFGFLVGFDAWFKGSPAEYGAGLKLAIERGWLWMHESGTYVKLTQVGADPFA